MVSWLHRWKVTIWGIAGKIHGESSHTGRIWGTPGLSSPTVIHRAKAFIPVPDAPALAGSSLEGEELSGKLQLTLR